MQVEASEIEIYSTISSSSFQRLDTSKFNSLQQRKYDSRQSLQKSRQTFFICKEWGCWCRRVTVVIMKKKLWNIKKRCLLLVFIIFKISAIPAYVDPWRTSSRVPPEYSFYFQAILTRSAALSSTCRCCC